MEQATEHDIITQNSALKTSNLLGEEALWRTG